MKVHKTRLSKFKIEIIIFSSHSDMKLGINSKRKAEKYANMWKLATLINQWVKEEIKKGNFKNVKKMKMETQYPKHIGCCKSISQREVYTNNAYLGKIGCK